MMLRHSTVTVIWLVSLLTVAAGLAGHNLVAGNGAQPVLERNKELARSLGLSDLCLFTEASYTRHLSVADINTPFQDSPLSLEHFPTGSLAGPPQHLHAAGRTRITVQRHGR